MKKYFISSVLFLIFNSADAQNLTVAKAINMAGRQRMLVNKMAKSYMAIGGNIRASEASKDLDEISATFNENQRELTNFARSKETKDAIAIANSIWSDYRMRLTSEPQIANAESVIFDSKKLVNACNVVVEKIVLDYPTTANAMLVNNCGKQRMLLQKIAMLYLAKSWGVDYSLLDRDIKDTIIALDTNLTMQTSAKENTAELITSLTFQKEEWAFLKNTFNSDVIKATNIYSSTNLMVKDFDDITAMYAKLAEEGKLSSK